MDQNQYIQLLFTVSSKYANKNYAHMGQLAQTYRTHEEAQEALTIREALVEEFQSDAGTK